MSAEENKAVVRRFIEEVVNRKDLDVMDELFAEDAVHHAGVQTLQGREALRTAEAAYAESFPDETVTVEDLVAEGDRVAARWSWRGTHEGEFAGYRPTYRVLRTEGIHLYRLVDGRIAEMWEYYDQAGFHRQLAEEAREAE